MDTIYFNTCFASAAPGNSLLDQPDSFLCESELEKLSTLRSPKRREEWLLGRWTAKNLVKASRPDFYSFSLREIEITNAPSGAPLVRFPGCEAYNTTLSISHSSRAAICALTFNPDLQIGTDLEQIETRYAGLAADYFTNAEAGQIAAYPPEQRDTAINLVWSVKESMLKSLKLGLRLDTRKIEVLSIGSLTWENGSETTWRPLEVQSHTSQELYWAAWWKKNNGFVNTISLASFKPIASGNISLTGVNCPLAGSSK